MDIIHACCAGLDVHKKTVVACIRSIGPHGTVSREVRTFGTTTAELLALSDGLGAYGVGPVARKSTGVYSVRAIIAGTSEWAGRRPWWRWPTRSSWSSTTCGKTGPIPARIGSPPTRRNPRTGVQKIFIVTQFHFLPAMPCVRIGRENRVEPTGWVRQQVGHRLSHGNDHHRVVMAVREGFADACR